MNKRSQSFQMFKHKQPSKKKKKKKKKKSKLNSV